MADPLGLIGPGAGGVGGMGGVGGSLPMSRQGGNAAPAEGPSFKEVLLKNLEQVNRLQQEATTAIEDLQTGRRGDLEGVLLATQKADTAFRMLLQVRNKVQAAFEEIKQIRV